MNKKKWTPQEIEQLKQHQAKGIPKIEGKTENATYRKMKSLGIPINYKKPPWTPQQIQILKTSDGTYIPNIPGKTKKATQHKMHQLGIYNPKTPTNWTPQEIQQLKQHSTNQQTGTPHIPGRTKYATYKKIKELKIPYHKTKKRGKHQLWTPQEIQQLHQIAQGHQTTIKNRTPKAIQRKIKELNLKQDRKYQQWTPQEIQLLKQNKPIPGRTPKTINRKRIELRILKRKPRKTWTKNNEKQLKQLVKQGYTAKQIHQKQLLPKKFTHTSIQKKMSRLHITKKPPPYKKFTKTTQKQFEKYLQQNWKNNIPQELADQWNQQHPNDQIGHRRVIKYLTKLKIKVSSYEMARIKRQKQKEKQIVTQCYYPYNYKATQHNAGPNIRRNKCLK